MNVKEEKNVLGIRIKLQRKRMGLNNIIIADKLGVHKSAVSNWISGHRYPEVETLMELADVLNTSMDYLNGTTENYYPQGATMDLRDVLKNQSVNFGETEMTVEQREAAVQIFDILKGLEEKK